MEVESLKTLIRTASVVLLCACVSTAYAQEQVTPQGQASSTITINQALELACRNNPNLRIAVNRVQRARGVVAEARANFNPNFNASLVERVQGPPVTFDLPEGGTIDIVEQTNTAANLNMFLPLDISNRLGYSSDIAKYQFQIDYLDLLATSEQLILDVKTAYYNLLRACGQQQTAQSAVDAAVSVLNETTARFEEGAIAKFDVTRAEVSVANLNQALIATKNRVLVAQATLNQVMGIDINTPTTVIKPDIPTVADTVDIPKRVEEAYVNRPEVKAANTAIALNEKNVRLQRTGTLPSASITGDLNYTFKVSGFNATNENYLVAAVLSVPIWDGGVTKARVQQARADVAASQNSLDQTKLNVALEVRTAALDLQEAAQRTQSTTQNVTLGEEALRLAEVRYQAGIATLVEVTDAQNALTLARFNNVASQYDYATAIARLQRATATQPELCNLQLLDPKL